MEPKKRTLSKQKKMQNSKIPTKRKENIKKVANSKKRNLQRNPTIQDPQRKHQTKKKQPNL